MLDAESPYTTPGPALTTALREGAAAGRARIEEALTDGAAPSQSGWRLTYHAFDDNLRREAPDEPERRANRLPAPAGPFRPLLRIYEPRDAVLDGRDELPPDRARVS